MNAEEKRLEENKSAEEPWHFWGPYLAERAWGTVREDYSANGDAWNYFPHDHARSRAYRWNEDGLGGISDYKGRLCFAFAFWNERDPFLKERLFGVGGPEGNHGEDVKELYWYLDNTPTHSFMRMIYRYPQSRFPYEELVAQSGARSKMDGEFEIWNTKATRNGFGASRIQRRLSKTRSMITSLMARSTSSIRRNSARKRPRITNSTFRQTKQFRFGSD